MHSAYSAYIFFAGGEIAKLSEGNGLGAKSKGHYWY